MGRYVAGPSSWCQRIALCLAVLWPLAAQADDRQFRLAASETLVESGLFDYLLPRFSLKTGVRIEVVPEGAEAELSLGRADGRAAFVGEGATWRLRLIVEHPGAARFVEWLDSEIGQRTITSYEVAGVAPFTLPEVEREQQAAVVFEGDPAEGLRVAQAQCGRCHVVDPDRRMGGIGSTPSFSVLRTMVDWDLRFQTFYVLRPHPAFTQVTGVTSPFARHLPSPIAPVEVSPEELEAIVAYVSGLKPADLGAPLQLQ